MKVAIFTKNNELTVLNEEKTHVVMDTRADLFDKKVVAFGFYNGVMTVRVK